MSTIPKQSSLQTHNQEAQQLAHISDHLVFKVARVLVPASLPRNVGAVAGVKRLNHLWKVEVRTDWVVTGIRVGVLQKQVSLLHTPFGMPFVKIEAVCIAHTIATSIVTYIHL